jgi:hypothetical protein
MDENLQEQTGAETAQEQPPIDNEHVEEGAEQFHQDDAPAASPETADSILKELLVELEGANNMSKSEIHAVVDRARAKYESL